MAGAKVAAPSGPSLLFQRLSYAHKRDQGGHTHVMDREPRVEMHVGVSRWVGVWDGMDFSVPKLVTR